MAGASSPSDLGRRLRHRREELGYSVERVAAGASIDAGYLDYLETSPDPDPARGTVLRLAMALKTSPVGLLGGDEALPSGHGVVVTGAQMVELDPAACLELIRPGGVGRVVFVDTQGPVALPVNFGVLNGAVVFRTATSTSIAGEIGDRGVSFEVDRIDDAFAEGWSVLLRGTAHRVADQLERQSIDALGVRPWAGGARELYFRLEPDVITGRQLVTTH